MTLGVSTTPQGRPQAYQWLANLNQTPCLWEHFLLVFFIIVFVFIERKMWVGREVGEDLGGLGDGERIQSTNIV